MKMAKNMVKKSLYALTLLSLHAFSYSHASPWHYESSLSVSTQHGSIQGAPAAQNTYAYKGIPYAAPPTGGLRWKAPQDPSPWGDSLDASNFGNICMQIGTVFGAETVNELGRPIGSEDCLNLNVWRPNTDQANLPVLVWIHGGSNSRGSSAQNIYDGANLAAKANAIVISMNFRLGALGWAYNSFLDNDDPLDSSGNYALLDMVKALEWIETNIRNFGGNPNKVTIAGNSSGCGSVWGLLHTPLSEGLIDRAICSGGFPQGLDTQTGQLISDSLVDNLFVAFGQAPDLAAAAALRQSMDQEDIAAFMRNVPAEIFAMAAPRVPSNYIDGYVLPTEISIESVAAGSYHQVPFMMGTTKNEESYVLGVLAGFFNAKAGASDPLLWEQLNADPSTLTATDIIDPAYQPVFPSIEEISSYGWNLAADNVVSAMSQNRVPVYRYDLSWNQLPAPWDEVLGATHTLDLAFLFGNFITDEDNPHKFAWTAENKENREQVSDQFIKYIANFMRSGHPLKTKNAPFWMYWNDWGNNHLGRRMIIDSDIESSHERYSYDGYLELYNNLSEFEQGFMDRFLYGFPLQH